MWIVNEARRARFGTAREEKASHKKSEAFFRCLLKLTVQQQHNINTWKKNEKVKQFENLKSTRVASSTAHNIAQRRHTSEINWNSNSTSYWIRRDGEWVRGKSVRERERKETAVALKASLVHRSFLPSSLTPLFLRNAVVTHTRGEKSVIDFIFTNFHSIKIVVSSRLSTP